MRGRYLPNSVEYRLLRTTGVPSFEYPGQPAIVGPVEQPAIVGPVEQPAIVAAPPTDHDRARAFMEENLQRNRNRIRPPPIQYTDPSDYSRYMVENAARNFPRGHDYNESLRQEKPVLKLSPEAEAYEQREKQLADNLESYERHKINLVRDLDLDLDGGRRKKKRTTQQKKDRRRRYRRHHVTKKHLKNNKK
jgi:hypothetical protein